MFVPKNQLKEENRMQLQHALQSHPSKDPMANNPVGLPMNPTSGQNPKQKLAQINSSQEPAEKVEVGPRCNTLGEAKAINSDDSPNDVTIGLRFMIDTDDLPEEGPKAAKKFVVKI